MKVLFMFMFQLIVFGMLLKLVVRMLIPRVIRKIFVKSSTTLIHGVFNFLKSIRDDFEEDDDDYIEYDDCVDDDKVIYLDARKK